jgi:putative nucleotidyltransferase with HDIG domain
MNYSTGFEELSCLPPQEERYDKVLDLVAQVNLSDLSSIKQSVTAIINVISDPQSTVKELKDIILLDPPLAMRVLKTANSAYYSRSFSRSFTDIEQAIIWMGSDIIKELALNQKVCEIFEKDEEFEEYSRKKLWRHSIAVAMTAKAIFRKEFGLRGENAYVAGLLHDIGVIAEDQFLQEDFKKVLHLTKSKNMDLPTAEEEIFSFNHAEVGAAICGSWGLPDQLVASTSCHHSPSRSALQFSKISATLFIADFICQENGYCYGIPSPVNKEILYECLKVTEIKSHALDIIFKSIKLDLAQMEDKGLF